MQLTLSFETVANGYDRARGDGTGAAGRRRFDFFQSWKSEIKKIKRAPCA
jgi:hypothetical protein